MEKTDRRREKTRASIYEALSGLLEEKKFANITVQEIIDRANVGRSTFYTHFETKDVLLDSMIEEIFESLNLNLTVHMNEAGHQNMLPVEELLTHIQENLKPIRGILKDESGERLAYRLKNCWNDKLKDDFLKQVSGKDLKVPVDFLINHITSSLVEMITWWLDSGMQYPPSKMAEYWKLLMKPAMFSVIAEQSRS
ncbi:TetR family transcriptional regulator [Acetobacterium fimetarium]|uniref:TetR family transcriptional regulator n=1 Tax=Acetobacterium fimetarium TaxID=52691 RepID=A0ABR6WUU1_9FIRM|nr:TetR/AcrR family transcriptional regulator [Acetobacterium fimetarium]MBC3803986.1 TetR family transcriptional regulator [Acetobacterium fimetarium]